MDALNYVFSRYLEPDRYYHDIDHIIDLLSRARIYGDKNKVFDSNGLLIRPLYEAILFHDFHYDVVPQSPHSNEEYSAIQYGLFATRNQDRKTSEIDHVMSMIRATEHHFDGFETDDYLTNLLLDIDILGFAYDYEKFIEIQENVDQEFLLYYPESYVKRARYQFFKDIVEKKSLFFRVIKNKSIFNEVAYNNLERYLRVNQFA